jgi:hypothetical protein
VAGVTKNVDHLGCGSSLDNAANTAPVGGFQIRAGDLAPKYGDLVAQHEDLDLVGAVASHGQRDQLKNDPHDRVPKRQDHSRQHRRTSRPRLHT